VLDLEIDGRDEQDALLALQVLLENRFDEPE
jgi:phosphotransferase system HPr-like phosphotransfer protein